MSSVLGNTSRTACASSPCPYCRARSKYGQCPRRVEIRVGVEALDERIGLVPQVALDLELGLGQQVADVVGKLQPTAELVVQGRGGEVRDVSDHARHAHAGRRAAPVP